MDLSIGTNVISIHIRIAAGIDHRSGTNRYKIFVYPFHSFPSLRYMIKPYSMISEPLCVLFEIPMRQFLFQIVPGTVDTLQNEMPHFINTCSPA